MGKRATKSNTSGSIHAGFVNSLPRTRMGLAIGKAGKPTSGEADQRSAAKVTYHAMLDIGQRRAAGQALVADMATALNRLEGVEFDAETAALIERHENEQVPIDEGARALLDHIRKRSGS